MAVRQGFEPWIRYKRMLVFKTSAFDRSATSPHVQTKETSRLERRR